MAAVTKPEEWPPLFPEAPGGGAPTATAPPTAPSGDTDAAWPSTGLPGDTTGAPPVSLLDTVGHGLAQGTGAAAQGLASLYDLAALPQNLIARLTGADWLRAKPVDERVNSLLDAANLSPVEPTLANQVHQGCRVGAAAAGRRRAAAASWCQGVAGGSGDCRPGRIGADRQQGCRRADRQARRADRRRRGLRHRREHRRAARHVALSATLSAAARGVFAGRRRRGHAGRRPRADGRPRRADGGRAAHLCQPNQRPGRHSDQAHQLRSQGARGARGTRTRGGRAARRVGARRRAAR